MHGDLDRDDPDPQQPVERPDEQRPAPARLGAMSGQDAPADELEHRAPSASTLPVWREYAPAHARASSSAGSIPASTSGHSDTAIVRIRERSKSRPAATRSPITSDQAWAIQKITTEPTSESVIVWADACSSNIAPTRAETRIEP
jgi:hypothetical protein